MKLITKNPYRIVGIHANASAREIQARKGKISAYAKVGKEITSEFDLPFLNSIERTTSLIDKAFSDIEQDQNKVFYSLFWFINLNTIDSTALQHLISGNKEKAIEIWNKLTYEKEVTTKNFSAFNNISSLYLLEESREEIKKGITFKIKLIESDSFKDFVHSIADKTFTIDKNKQIEILIDEILKQYKKKYSSIKIIELFSNCNETSTNYLSKKITEEPIYKIEVQIEQCTQKRLKSKSIADKFGSDLYKNTKEEFKLLKTLLGNNDLKYKFITDSIAKEFLNCGIDYFLSNGKKEEFIDKTIQIFEFAKEICINQSIKVIIEEKINEIQSIKYEDIDSMLILLKGISVAIKDLNRENKFKPYHQKKSINVQKIDELILNEITLFRFKKLLKIQNKTYLAEFISHVIFIRSELYSSTGIKKIINMLVKNLPQTHEFVISEREKQRKIDEELDKRNKEEREQKRKDKVENIAGYVCIGIGVVAGLIVLGWAISLGNDWAGFIMGGIFGFVIGRIVFFISALPIFAILSIINFITKKN
jgi:hypothetical protein